MIIRETLEAVTKEKKVLISYPIQWGNMIIKPKWSILDLVVTKIFMCIHNGEQLRLYRYGKCETIEGDLGKTLSWRETLPKAE